MLETDGLKECQTKLFLDSQQFNWIKTLKI